MLRVLEKLNLSSAWLRRGMLAVTVLIFRGLFLSQALAHPTQEKRIQVLIPATCFEMGSDVYIVEEPYHEVCLDAFMIDATEVTQKQYEDQTGLNPSRIKGANLPVTGVNWSEAKNFCDRTEGRLPTEAEWEFAAGLGKESLYSWGYDMEKGRAWYAENSKGKMHPVATTQANDLGIYDLNGNVWEWVADWFSPTFYETGPKQNPKGPKEGQHRLIRGGSFNDPEALLRTAYRYWYPPEWRSGDIGFRCASTPQKAEKKGTLK